jgi:CysZ protein
MELSGFGKGFIAAFQSFGFVFKHRFVHFYFYSFFISLALIIAFLWLGWESAAWLADFTMAKAKNVLAYFSISSEENSYTLVLTFIFNFILRFLGIYLVLKFSKYILLVLLSPLFAYISEVAEQKRTGQRYPIGFTRIIKRCAEGRFYSHTKYGVRSFLDFFIVCCHLNFSTNSSLYRRLFFSYWCLFLWFFYDGLLL